MGSQVGGNETYSVQLVRALARIDSENQYRLYVTRAGPEVAALAAALNFTLVHLWPCTAMVRIPVSQLPNDDNDEARGGLNSRGLVGCRLIE